MSDLQLDSLTLQSEIVRSVRDPDGARIDLCDVVVTASIEGRDVELIRAHVGPLEGVIAHTVYPSGIRECVRRGR